MNIVAYFWQLAPYEIAYLKKSCGLGSTKDTAVTKLGIKKFFNESTNMLLINHFITAI